MKSSSRSHSVILCAGWLWAGALTLAAGCGSDGIGETDDRAPELTTVDELSGRTPVLSTIAPSMGPDTGSGGVTITGKNFRAGTTVTFGGTAAGYVSVASTTSLSVGVPARPGAFGPVTVRVTNPDGRYVERSDLFSYYSDKIAWTSPGRQDLSFYAITAAAGDFNKDGRQDLAVMKDYTGQLQVLLGTANGDYALGSTPSAGIPGFGSPPALLVRDFDGDGNLDLIVSAVYTDSAVLLGKGDGTFAAPITRYPGAGMIAVGNPVDVGELVASGDSTPELLIGTAYSNNFYVALANPAVPLPGTAISIDSGLTGMRLVRIIDVNKDGKNDLVGLASSTAQLSVVLNKGGGSADTPRITTTAAMASDVQFDDLNGDGKLDLAIYTGDGKLAVQLGNGDGTFGSPSTSSVSSDAIQAVRLRDLNGDGKVDALALLFHAGDPMTGAGAGNSLAFLAGKGDGTFAAAAVTPLTFGANRFELGDVNGDGKADVTLAQGYSSSSLAVLIGLGNGSFQDRQAIPVGATPATVLATDFNGDGKLDLAAANFSAGQVSVLLGSGSRIFPSRTTLTVGTSPSALVSGDFNGDGKRDLVAANYDSATVSLLAGNGDGTFQAQRTFATGSGPIALAAADLNADSKLDLVVANTDSDNISVLLNNGSGFAAAVSYSVGKGPTGVAVGDFNGDGRPDLIVANSGATSLSLLQQSAATRGTFNTAKSITLPYAPTSVAVADLSADGKADLAVSYVDAGYVGMLIGSGSATFPTSSTYAAGGLPGDLGIADFNRDGTPDVAVNCEGSNSVILRLGFGNGTFFPAQRSPGRAAAGSMAVVDLDGDGRPDLLLVNEAAGTVALQMNAVP